MMCYPLFFREDVMDNNLLPCPFCGGEPYALSYVGWYGIYCVGCGVQTNGEYKSKLLAQQAWNTRDSTQTKGEVSGL